MKAEDTHVTNLLEGAKQFIVPIFQRDYSWGTRHCQQLWKDVIRVGSDGQVQAPTKPGLGYDVDWEAIGRLTVREL